MFNFCPSCGAKGIELMNNKFNCHKCGFIYYHNTAAATGCLITVPDDDGELIVFTVRGKEPGKGMLDIPGGFVDPGEGIFEGLYRELREEIGWAPEIPKGQTPADVFKLFASFANIYHYKGINYNTCDMYFTVSAPGPRPQDLKLEAGEIDKVLFLKPKDIDFNRFAFESVKKAVKLYLEKYFR